MSSVDFKALVIAVSQSQTQTVKQSIIMSTNDINILEGLKDDEQLQQRLREIVKERERVIAMREEHLYQSKKSITKNPGIELLTDLIKILEGLISDLHTPHPDTGDVGSFGFMDGVATEDELSDEEWEVIEVEKFNLAIQEAAQYGLLIAECQAAIVKRIQRFFDAKNSLKKELMILQALKGQLEEIVARFGYEEYVNDMEEAEKQNQLWSTKLGNAELDLKICSRENEYLNHIASVTLSPS